MKRTGKQETRLVKRVKDRNARKADTNQPLTRYVQWKPSPLDMLHDDALQFIIQHLVHIDFDGYVRFATAYPRIRAVKFRPDFRKLHIENILVPAGIERERIPPFMPNADITALARRLAQHATNYWADENEKHIHVSVAPTVQSIWTDVALTHHFPLVPPKMVPGDLRQMPKGAAIELKRSERRLDDKWHASVEPYELSRITLPYKPHSWFRVRLDMECITHIPTWLIDIQPTCITLHQIIGRKGCFYDSLLPSRCIIGLQELLAHITDFTVHIISTYGHGRVLQEYIRKNCSDIIPFLPPKVHRLAVDTTLTQEAYERIHHFSLSHRLELHFDTPHAQHFDFTRLPSLTFVDVYCNDTPLLQRLTHQLATLPNLKTVRVRSHALHDQRGFVPTVWASAPKLDTLLFCGINVRDCVVQLIESMPHIRYFAAKAWGSVTTQPDIDLLDKIKRSLDLTTGRPDFMYINLYGAEWSRYTDGHDPWQDAIRQFTFRHVFGFEPLDVT